MFNSAAVKTATEAHERAACVIYVSVCSCMQKPVKPPSTTAKVLECSLYYASVNT